MSAALKNDISIQIQNIQVEYMPKIQAATVEADFVKLQSLMKEMEMKITTLVEDHAVALPPSLPVASFHYITGHSDLDLNHIVYCEEVSIYSKLNHDLDFKNLIDQIKKTIPSIDIRKELMRNYLKLDLQLSPKLSEVVARCKTTLRIKSEIQVYLINSPESNAYCPPPSESTIFVCLTSTLLEKLSVDELCFVFGHEIGHALMNHHEIPLQYILYSGCVTIRPDHMLSIFAHKRAAELTCDRFGLICGQTFENAARGVFKIYYGLSDLADSSIHTYMQSFGDLNTSLTISPADYYSTHPFGPIRLIALQLFASSEKFHKAVGSEGWQLSSEELEAKLFTLMDVYDATNVTPEMQAILDKFFVLCSIAIVASDGTVTEGEVTKMSELCKTPGVVDEMMHFQTATIDQFQVEIFNLSQPLMMNCSIALRMNLMRDLIYVAIADGILTETEMNILYFCSQWAGVETTFIESVLNDIKKLA